MPYYKMKDTVKFLMTCKWYKYSTLTLFLEILSFFNKYSLAMCQEFTERLDQMEQACPFSVSNRFDSQECYVCVIGAWEAELCELRTLLSMSVQMPSHSFYVHAGIERLNTLSNRRDYVYSRHHFEKTYALEWIEPLMVSIPLTEAIVAALAKARAAYDRK